MYPMQTTVDCKFWDIFLSSKPPPLTDAIFTKTRRVAASRRIKKPSFIESRTVFDIVKYVLAILLLTYASRCFVIS